LGTGCGLAPKSSDILTESGASPSTTAAARLAKLSVLVVGDSGREERGDAIALAEVLAPLLGADLVRVRVVTQRQQADEPARAAELTSPEASVPEIIASGSPARVLHELAESRHAAMLVLGSSHRAGLGRILPGGVGGRLLQGGPCPIAVAPRGFAKQAPGEPRVIGVAFDHSPESHGALKLAARLAEAASAALRVTSVYEGPPPQPERTSPGVPTAYEHVQEALRNAVRPLPRELRAEPRFRSGDPARTLVAESELGLDLLVMGSRGYGPLRSVLLGGVSEAVVRAAACPVILIPRGAPAISERR
jgi:nucleotide-binding universal stress UspA family protein